MQTKNLYYVFGIMTPSVTDAFLAGFYTVYLLRYLSLSEIAIQYAFFLFIITVADFPTGSLVDHWGARNCMLLSYGLMMGGYVSLLFVDSLTPLVIPLFFAIHLCFATSVAQESGTIIAWFTNQWKNTGGDMTRIRQVYGKASAISLVAKTIAAIIGGFLTQYLSISLVFLGAIGHCFIGMLLAIQLGTRPINNQSESTTYLRHLHQAFIIVWHERRLVLLISMSCLNYAAWFVVSYLAIQPLVYDGLQSIFLLCVFVATLVGAQAAGYYVSGKIQRLQDITASLLFFSPIPWLYFLLFLGISVWPIGVTLVGLLLTRLVTGLYNPHMQQFYQRLTPNEYRAVVTSLRSSAVSGATIVFTVASGVILHTYGITVGFLLASGLGIVSFFLLLITWLITRQHSTDNFPSC